MQCTFLCSILLDYDFNKLEDIWFTSASNFTMATIELLLELPELLSIGIIFKLYPFPLLSSCSNTSDVATSSVNESGSISFVWRWQGNAQWEIFWEFLILNLKILLKIIFIV